MAICIARTDIADFKLIKNGYTYCLKNKNSSLLDLNFFMELERTVFCISLSQRAFLLVAYSLLAFSSKLSELNSFMYIIYRDHYIFKNLRTFSRVYTSKQFKFLLHLFYKKFCDGTIFMNYITTIIHMYYFKKITKFSQLQTQNDKRNIGL